MGKRPPPLRQDGKRIADLLYGQTPLRSETNEPSQNTERISFDKLLEERVKDMKNGNTR